MATPLRIGTRGSELALWQANHIAARLREHGHEVAVEVIRTTGDRMQDPAFLAAQQAAQQAQSPTPGAEPPDAKGIFTKELEEALLAGRIDLAVHSLKDLPTRLSADFRLAAIPARADARDALVCEAHWGLHMLPSGARIATTSPRRQAMLLALRPDLTFVPMRGNIDTRLRKWEGGAADALVLAAAGLDRLQRTEHVHQRFSVDELCPAPGQGALALEVAAHAPSAILEALQVLNDPATQFATEAERHVLDALGGGCQLPLGAFCHATDTGWRLHAMVVAPDGDEVLHLVENAAHYETAEAFGHRVARVLESRGAVHLLSAHAETNAQALA